MGILVRMGVSMRQFGMDAAALVERLSDEQGAISLNYPTNLTRISEEDFDLLSRHGAEVCEATLATYTQK
ncbi:hypothetical protein FB480_105175 [Agrobacterium vitis]|nr:hypothetical protein FB480_105175 [Agrobacterium vitis]